MPDNTITRPGNNPSLLTYEAKTLLRFAGMVSYLTNTKLGLQKAEREMKEAANELIIINCAFALYRVCIKVVN